MGYLKRFTGTNTIFRYGGFYSFLKRKDQLSVYIKSQVFTGKAINQISLSKGENFINDPANNRNINYHDKVLLNGINTTLVDDFLYKMDAATMANSIESRPPFLDHRIIEFTSKLKTLGLMPNKIDKEVTRTLAYKYVPKELVDTPKLGFSIPVKKYFKAEWAKTLLDKMDGKKIMDLEIFNKKGIEKLLNDYKTNDFDQLEKVFFGILSFILWYETFDEN
jgi:asparagine synthase (glutamine-hydrolysing)